MPKGVQGAYSSDYITRSVKHGAMNEANESSLHREGLDSHIMGENSGAFTQSEQSSSGKGSAHTAQLGMIMGQSKSHK